MARHCGRCGEPVIWAATEAGKRQPLNPQPDLAGNVAAYRDVVGNWHARAVQPGADVAFPERVYMPHAATCSAPTRKPKAAVVRGDNVIDFAAARARRLLAPIRRKG